MKKFLLIVMTITLCACLFISCNHTPTEEPETVSYKVFVPDGAPAMAVAKMMKDGENVADNREFSYTVLGGNDQAALISSKITTEEADFIIVPTNLGVKLSVLQGKYLLAATTSWGNLCLVTNDSSLKTFSECENKAEFMAQLSGKTVASIGAGAVPDVSFKYILAQNDITDCTVTASSLANIQDDFAKSNISLGILGEPAATATTKKVEGTKILCNVAELWKATTGLDFPQASLFVKKSVAQNDKATVDAFLTKLQASIAYLNQNADNALELGTYMENTGESSLKGAIVKLSYKEMRQKYVSALEAKDSVIRFVNVLGVNYDENTADIFYK